MGKHGGLKTELLALLAVLSLGFQIGCSRSEENPQPVVTVQTASAERGSIQQIITSEAILFPRDQAAITPKVVAPVKQFYVNRGSRVHRGQLLAVLENRDLAAAEVENKERTSRPKPLTDWKPSPRCPRSGRRPSST